MEQVLFSPSNASTGDHCALPDDLPGQSNTTAAVAAASAAAAGGLSAAAEPFSFFSAPLGRSAAAETTEAAAAVRPVQTPPARLAVRARMI